MDKRLPNRAFVFVKPHAAVSECVIDAVRETLLGYGIDILAEGGLTGPDIDRQGIVDRHYAAIAGYGVLRDPAAVRLGDMEQKRFAEIFGVEWREGNVRNARQFLEESGLSAEALNVLWEQAAFTKVMPGLYVAKLEAENCGARFVINGFYPSLREKLTKAEALVHWFDTSVMPETLPWRDFRAKVIGATDPAKAHPDSIRGRLYRHPERYQLRQRPTIQQNGIHASAGPLEAARERLIWRGSDCDCLFLDALREHGVGEARIRALLENVPVGLDGGPPRPVFDILEDVDAEDALRMLLA